MIPSASTHQKSSVKMFQAIIFTVLITAWAHRGVQADLFEDTFDLSSEESISASMDVAFGEFRSELGPLLHGPVENTLEAAVRMRCANRDLPSFSQIFYDDPSSWKEFDVTKPITIIVHGWLDDSDNVWVQQTAHELLKIHDSTVCVMDWKYRARYNYREAVQDHTPFVADFITRLILFTHNGGMPFQKFTLIGHNVGAHICGQVGWNLGGKIGEIYGLDPSGPLFEYPVDRGLELRLDSTDAMYVQIIITTRTELGLIFGQGHDNFYPNGGLSAGNCPLPDTTSHELTVRIACSEWEATEYFRQSLNPTNIYEGRLCSDWPTFLAHRCDSNDANILGIYSHRVGGNFYLIADPILPNFPAFSSHAH